MYATTRTVVVSLFLFLAAAGQEYSMYTFEVGGGHSVPAGATGDRFEKGWNLLFGGGYKFTPQIAGLLELQAD